MSGLDAGETDAIALAIAVDADLILIDERAGFSVAQQQGLNVTGTLGVLDLAADRGLIDFAAAILALEQTNFRRPGALLRVLLAKHGLRKRKLSICLAARRCRCDAAVIFAKFRIVGAF